MSGGFARIMQESTWNLHTLAAPDSVEANVDGS